MKKFGLYFGRLQPPHKGHMSIIDTMISMGYTPVILLGSAQVNRTKKNPYTYAERVAMIHSVHPDVLIMPLFDLADNTKWVEQWKNILSALGGESTLFMHNKETEKGKYGVDNYITDLLIPVVPHHIDLSQHTTVDVCATDIRNSLGYGLDDAIGHLVDEPVLNHITTNNLAGTEFFQQLKD